MFIIKQYLHTYTNSANNHNINNLSSVGKSVEKKFSTLNISTYIQNIK